MKQSEALHLRGVIESAMDGEFSEETALVVVTYGEEKRVRSEGILHRFLQPYTGLAAPGVCGWEATKA